MLSNERKEFFEEMFRGFTEGLFALETIPPMYIAVFEDKAHIIPNLPMYPLGSKEYTKMIFDYARHAKPDYMGFVFEGSQYEGDEHGNKIKEEGDALIFMIGEPSGAVHVILGDIEYANDKTPYVSAWNWANSRGDIADITTNILESYDD